MLKRTPTRTAGYSPGPDASVRRVVPHDRALLTGLVLALCGGFFSSAALAFTQSVHVNFTLEGCRNDGSITLPNGSGQFICPDSAYTTGNLGKGWNELDLVPHRLTTGAGGQANATTDYDVIVAADYQTSGKTGYDVIFVPGYAVNTAKSDASCTISPGAQAITGSVTGGADQVIYRQLTIHQNQGTTCVFDYDQRLALGAHLYSGSSLQSYMFEAADFKTGKRTLSIPVNEILPQKLSKNMTATQGSDHTWNIQKGPTDAKLTFGNTCDPTQPTSQGLQITVTWTKEAASPFGDITVTTHVYATNPAARVITTNVTDVIYSGTTPLDTANSGDVDVPANTTNQLVLVHTYLAASGTIDLNDIATATYTDKVTGVAIPGQTTATASATVQLSGPELNQTAVINDVESFLAPPTALKFSADSFAGATGAFDGGYVAGTPTIDPVSWTSLSQSTGGSVVFDKTLHVTQATSENATLHDVATLTGFNGFTANASADVVISADARVKLTITKTIPNILQGGETLTIPFVVTGPSPQNVSIAFGAFETSKSVTLDNLAPGSYSVHEDTGNITDQNGNNVKLTGSGDQAVNLNLPTCSSTAAFEDSIPTEEVAKATAQKVTVPAGSESGWEFTLYFCGADQTCSSPSVMDVLATDSASAKLFGTPLVDEGWYTIRETEQPPLWVKTNVSDGCTFQVNYPASEGQTYSCVVTNTEQGKAKVVKTVSGSPPSGSESFTFQIRQGASATLAGTTLETGTADAGNGGVINFTTLLVPGNTYQLCEIVMPGWLTTLGPPLYTVFNPSGDNSVVCTDFAVGAGETRAFDINNLPPPGGFARTIGFWKNWASCSQSKGGQEPVLDETLEAAGGHILIGNLDVDSCEDAVSILNKSTVDTGKKMASDPAFNLAAQLLAAKLNVQAGAGVCLAAVIAINNAQDILDGPPPSYAKSFTGTGSYPKSGQFATTANSLATALDKYNNNTLCQ